MFADDKEVLDGVCNGFRLISSDELCNVKPSVLSNHRSALANEKIVSDIVKDEIDRGRYEICDPGCHPLIVSPLGLVPKGDGGHRLIHDCSVPRGGAVNDYAVLLDKQSYESVDVAVSFMSENCYMAKVDIKSAYRAVACHPDSFLVTGLQWSINGRTTYLFDKRLPFGARPSPTHFHKISQCIKRIMQRKGFSINLVAYQDDFLIVSSSHAECTKGYIELMDLLRRLGFTINMSKAVPPCQILTFLGIELNSKAMTISLPENKLQGIKATLHEFIGKVRATKRQLQSLAGKLNHASKVVRGGRTFMRRILNSIRVLKKKDHKCKLNGAVMKDILWWNEFMSQFNGVENCIRVNEAVCAATDACLTGGGAFYNGDFQYVNWINDYPEYSDLPINYKEATMAALCMGRWASSWRDRLVFIYTDNKCTVSIINKCSCKSDLVMKILRKNFWIMAQNNIHVKAVYLKGEENIMADAVSRLHEGFSRLCDFEMLYNEWYFAHHHIPNAFNHVSLCNHLSLSSLLTLQDRERFRCLRWPWMRSFVPCLQHH